MPIRSSFSGLTVCVAVIAFCTALGVAKGCTALGVATGQAAATAILAFNREVLLDVYHDRLLRVDIRFNPS